VIDVVFSTLRFRAVQSKHPAAQLHAVARAASGSAVYVSDKPGEHDFALLRRLVLPDGTVLRPLLPGLPTADILFNDPMCDGNTLLKVSRDPGKETKLGFNSNIVVVTSMIWC
jgi:hypothetical protein